MFQAKGDEFVFLFLTIINCCKNRNPVFMAGSVIKRQEERSFESLIENNQEILGEFLFPFSRAREENRISC